MISRKQLQNLLRMLFGLCVLVWIARQIEFSTLLALAERGDPHELALGVGFALAGLHGLQWTRLHLLIRSYTTSLATSLKIFYVGALFNHFLPSNLGGDAIRLLYLQGLRTENLGTPFMLLLLYRFSSFAVLMIAGFSYVLFDYPRLLALLAAQHSAVHSSAPTWLLAAAGLALTLLFGVWLRARSSQRLRARWATFAAGCRAAFALLSTGDLCSLVLQTVLFHFLRMLSFYYLVRFMGQRIALWDLAFVISATAVVSVLPITIAGFGVIEASITGLLALFGVELSCAGGVALVNRAVMLLAAAIGGSIYLSGAGERRSAQRASAERAT